MKIEPLTKALYFLNASDYRNSVEIEKIEGELVWFSNGKTMPVAVLANCYDNFVKYGELIDLW